MCPRNARISAPSSRLTCQKVVRAGGASLHASEDARAKPETDQLGRHSGVCGGSVQLVSRTRGESS